MKLKAKALVLIAAISLASIVEAAVVEYSDRASFEAALSSSTLLTFEGLGDQVNLGLSVDFGDLNVSNPGSVWAIDGSFGAPSGQIGDQNNQATIYTLQPGYRALGMDMGLLFAPGQINLTLRDEFGTIVASGLRSVADNNDLGLAGSTFYGWISDSDDLGNLQLDPGGFPTVDNLIFGDPPVADLSISKTDSADPVSAGMPLTYTIRVDNIGSAPAADVVVTDTLPAGVTLVSTAGCAEDPTAVPSCSLGSIAFGAFAEYTITVDVDPSILGTITNNASVITSSPERNLTNNTVMEDTLVSAEADLSITQVGEPDPFVSGGAQILVYTIEVNNAGPSDATNVVVTDILPSVAIFESTSGCLNDPVGVADCQLGTIGVGGSASYTITVTMPRFDGSVTNSVSVSSDAFDPNPVNNSSDLTIGVSAVAIPTLGGLGLTLLILLLGSVGWVSIRRT